MRSTRGQLIDQALQRVGNTTSSLITQARFRLNRILQGLHQGWDWPHLWTTIPMQVSTSGLVTGFPTNYLKAEDDVSLKVTATGGQAVAQVVLEVDHRMFYLAVPGGTIVDASFPRIWTFDYATRTGQAYPAPRDTCAAILRCKLLPADMPTENQSAYDADIPAFPFDTLLSDLLFEWAMSYEVDPRRAEQYQINADAVNRARGSAFPERAYPAVVQLDPVFFSTPFEGN